jgi:oligo-1,6-glucosidase
MKVNDDYDTWNAAAQLRDTDSVLTFWKKALRVRKAHDLLVPHIPLQPCGVLTAIALQVYGDFHLLAPDDERVFAFTRTLNADAKALVVLNFSTETASFDAAQLLELKGRAKLALCNHGEEGTTLEDVVKLDGYQGKIFIL